VILVYFILSFKHTCLGKVWKLKESVHLMFKNIEINTNNTYNTYTTTTTTSTTNNNSNNRNMINTVQN